MFFSKKIIVEDTCAEKRIDSFIASELNISRNQIQQLILNGHILINNNQIKAHYKLRPGDAIEIILPKPKKLEAEPQDLPLDIIYEDKDIVVINKQAGIVVHPGAGNYDGTLVNALLFHIKDLSSIGGIIRPGIVHRLDKETSGVLVVAKNDKAHEFLSRQFKNHEVQKEYLAICYGNPKENEGSIDTNIGRSTSDRKKMAVLTKKGRPAITKWKILSRSNNFLLVQVNPSTGRTHQIRVHLHYKHMPIICDTTYGYGKIEYSKLSSYINRVALHAHSLSFRHPQSNEYQTFKAELPSDFQEALVFLKLALPLQN